MPRTTRRAALVAAFVLMWLGVACAPESSENPSAQSSATTVQPVAATAGQDTMDQAAPSEMAPSESAMAEGDVAPPQAAPLPDAAVGPAIPSDKGYLVEEVADGLYWVTDGSYVMMFLTTGEGVIVVDAPPSIGKNILAAIGDVTDEPITHVIYSHSHGDHIAAAGLYPKDAVYIAHQATADQLAVAMDADREYPFGMFIGGAPVPLPTVTFDDQYTVEVGTQTLQLDYHGVNHEPGNIFIYAPKQRVLMVVDVVFPGWVPFKSLALAEDVGGYYAAHDQILAYDFDTFVGGHLGRLGTRQDVEVEVEYLTDVREAAANALKSVDFMAIGQEVGFGNAWVLFDSYLNALAQACADEVVPKWVNRLGGADVFTVDHCGKVVESLRIE